MIRPCTIEDLRAIAEMGREFYSEGKIPGTIVPDIFEKNWKGFLESEIGIVYVAEEDGKIIGTIGGLIYPDTNDGVKVLCETFWFVSKGHRGRCGFKLLDAFEKRGMERGAKRLVMVHLSSLAPEKLKKLYERLGYVEVETHYVKEIKEVG